MIGEGDICIQHITEGINLSPWTDKVKADKRTRAASGALTRIRDTELGRGPRADIKFGKDEDAAREVAYGCRR